MPITIPFKLRISRLFLERISLDEKLPSIPSPVGLYMSSKNIRNMHRVICSILGLHPSLSSGITFRAGEEVVSSESILNRGGYPSCTFLTMDESGSAVLLQASSLGLIDDFLGLHVPLYPTLFQVRLLSLLQGLLGATGVSYAVPGHTGSLGLRLLRSHLLRVALQQDAPALV